MMQWKGLALVGFGLATFACASDSGTPVPTPATVDARAAEDAAQASLRARIAELEAAVARDEEAIKTMISDPRRAPTLRTDPELLTIADRLPGLQRELERLRARVPAPPPGEEPSDEE